MQQQQAKPCTDLLRHSVRQQKLPSCASRHLTHLISPGGKKHLLIQANQSCALAVTTGMHSQRIQMFFQLLNIVPYTLKTELPNLSQDSVQPQSLTHIFYYQQHTRKLQLKCNSGDSTSSPAPQKKSWMGWYSTSPASFGHLFSSTPSERGDIYNLQMRLVNRRGFTWAAVSHPSFSFLTGYQSVPNWEPVPRLPLLQCHYRLLLITPRATQRKSWIHWTYFSKGQ